MQKSAVFAVSKQGVFPGLQIFGLDLINGQRVGHDKAAAGGADLVGKVEAGIPEEKKMHFDLEECLGQVLITFEKKINDKTVLTILTIGSQKQYEINITVLSLSERKSLIRQLPQFISLTVTIHIYSISPTQPVLGSVGAIHHMRIRVLE